MKKANENQEITIKDESQKHFIIVYESVYMNKKLTAEELGILTKLISLAPTFKPTQEKLMSLLHIGKKAFTKATKSLQEKGYLTIKKYGAKSEWIINQEPTHNITDFNKETLINALLNYDITMKDLKMFHKLKYIDDNLLIQITEEYIKQMQKIVKTKWIKKEF